MASKDQLNSQYINEKVNPLLEKLVVDLLIFKPENPVLIYFIFLMFFIFKKVGIHENLAR